MKSTKELYANKVTWKEYFHVLLTLAFPIAMQNLLTTTASMVDTIMIGSRGQLAVEAVGICSQIGSLFFSSYWGFACASMMFFAQYWGEKNRKGMSRTFGMSFIFMLAISMAFGLICIVKPEFFLNIYTDKANIVEAGIPYIRIVGFAFPLQTIGVLLGHLLRSTERVKPPLITSVVAMIVNFVLNWILIYGRFGMPEMGVAGAAVGTVASGVVNIVMLYISLLVTKCDVRIQLSEMFDFKGFFGIYMKKVGPILCNEMLYGVGQMIINIVIGHQDENAIAAMTAFRVLEGFVYAFFGGLASASSVSIGKEAGSGHPYRAYGFAGKAAIACPAITFLFILVCAIFNRPILGLFSLGPEALTYGKYMLYIYLLFGSVRTCNYIMNEGYRAGGESLFGTLVEIICLFAISVPMTWVSGMVWKLPFLAVFSFVFTDELIRLIIETFYTKSGKWLKPVTESGKAAMPEFWEIMNARKDGKKKKQNS